jgi:hypothetical protein
VPITAQSVLNHARDLHPSLAPVHTPEPLAWRQLSRQQESLWQDITRVVPAYNALQVTLPLPPPNGFANGWALADFLPGQGQYKDLLDVEVIWPQPRRRPTRATLVPFEQRDLRHRFPAVTFVNGALLPQGGETDWSTAESLVLTYTPLPSDVTAGDQVLQLPDDSRECLAYGLAAFFAGRLVGVPNLAVTPDIAGMLMRQAAEEQGRFLSRIRQIAQKQRYRIRNTAGYDT